MRQHGQRRDERALQVCFDYRIPCRLGIVARRIGADSPRQARVVDQHVDARPARDDRGDGRFRIAPHAEVRRMPECRVAELRDRRCQPLRIARHDRDAITVVDQAPRDRETDPARPARHQRRALRFMTCHDLPSRMSTMNDTGSLVDAAR